MGASNPAQSGGGDNSPAQPAGSSRYTALEFASRPSTHGVPPGVYTVRYRLVDANGNGIAGQTITSKFYKQVLDLSLVREAASEGLSKPYAIDAGLKYELLKTLSAKTDSNGFADIQYGVRVKSPLPSVVQGEIPEGNGVYDPVGYKITADFAGSSKWQPSQSLVLARITVLDRSQN